MVNTLHKNISHYFISQKLDLFRWKLLGPLTKNIKNSISKVVTDEWGEQIIKGWNKSNWMTQPDRIGNVIAKLIGASKNTVTVGDTLAIKLFQAISGAHQISKKGLILSDKSNFPSDLYIANSYLKDKNLSKVRLVSKNKIVDELNKGEVSILMLTHVDYRTGELYDLKKISKIARNMGIITIWDFAHSIGALPLSVKKDDIDLQLGAPINIYVVDRVHLRLYM